MMVGVKKPAAGFPTRRVARPHDLHVSTSLQNPSKSSKPPILKPDLDLLCATSLESVRRECCTSCCNCCGPGIRRFLAPARRKLVMDVVVELVTGQGLSSRSQRLLFISKIKRLKPHYYSLSRRSGRGNWPEWSYPSLFHVLDQPDCV